jgi:tripartite-type tricarboxylate transporter receptor subunit TctC
MVRLAVLFVASVLAVLPAAAQVSPKWPERPIRFIVPFQPGSSSDTVARVVGQRLSERLGQQLVIENRVGASGNIGTEAVARAEPDGYTIGLANTSTHVIAASLSSNLTYDPVKDFAPVAMLGSSPFILSVYTGLAAKSIPELIALAKSKPRALSYASAGPATSAHLSGALFEKLAQVELVHVPYRGSGQSVLDLVEGRVDMQFGTLPPTLALVRDGRVRALAVTGEKRTAVLPDVPTIAESGVPGYESTLWQAVVVPAATPPAIVARLNEEIVAALASPDVKATLEKQGIDLEPSTPAQLAARIRSDLVKWGEVIRGAGIKTQ